MTNREWLNSLSNDDLVNWIYAENTKCWDFKQNKDVIYAPNYSPCLNEVVIGWTSYRGRLRLWLDEERKDDNE